MESDEALVLEMEQRTLESFGSPPTGHLISTDI